MCSSLFLTLLVALRIGGSLYKLNRSWSSIFLSFLVVQSLYTLFYNVLLLDIAYNRLSRLVHNHNREICDSREELGVKNRDRKKNLFAQNSNFLPISLLNYTLTLASASNVFLRKYYAGFIRTHGVKTWMSNSSLLSRSKSIVTLTRFQRDVFFTYRMPLRVCSNCNRVTCSSVARHVYWLPTQSIITTVCCFRATFGSNGHSINSLRH